VDPLHFDTDPDSDPNPDPALFVSCFQDVNKKLVFVKFFYITF
jgi:hypothetical protein